MGLISTAGATFKTIGAVFVASTAEKAFDGTLSTEYGPYPDVSSSRAWIIFPQPVTVAEIGFTGSTRYTQSSNAPTSGAVYGSNNGGTTENPVTSWSLPYVSPPGEYRVKLSAPVTFSAFGFHLNPAMSGGYVPMLGEVRFYSDSSPASSPAFVGWGLIPI